MNQPFLSYEPELFCYNKDTDRNMKRAHFHSTYEIYYLISGKRRYFIENQYYELSPGDLILIPPRVVHKVLNSIHAETNSYHERYLLVFTNAMVDQDLLSCFDKFYYHPNDEDKIHIKQLLEKMGDELKRRDAYSLKMYKNYLTELLVIVSRKNYRMENASQNNESNKKILAIINEITTYIRNNHKNQNLSLEDIAERFGYSKEYLSKNFKLINGIGYSEFLTTTRLATSCELLISTSMSINEIAVNSGFKDSNYFISVFKKKLNTTPYNYRKNAYIKSNFK